MRTQDVTLRTCRRRWMIGRIGERGSGISVLAARHDDNDIYIYIYNHPWTDCFIVSHFFSVARHVGRLKLGLQPGQLYVRLSNLPLSQQVNHVSSGIIRQYVVAFVCLHFALPDTKVFNSFEELCIMRCATVRFLHQSLQPPWGWVYIIIHRLFRFITHTHTHTHTYTHTHTHIYIYI